MFKIQIHRVARVGVVITDSDDLDSNIHVRLMSQLSWTISSTIDKMNYLVYTGQNVFEESKSKMFSVLKILLKSSQWKSGWKSGWKSLQKYTQYVKLKPTSER